MADTVWTVLHLHFTVLCAGRLTLLGYAWLIWLAHHCLPAAAVTRLALQHPNTCILPGVVMFSGVCFWGRTWWQMAAESRVAVNFLKRV